MGRVDRCRLPGLRYTRVQLPLPKNDASALGRVFDAVIERQSEETVRTRAQGGFFVFGGVLALVSLLLPHAAAVLNAGVVAIGCFAIVSGVLLLAVPRIMPPQLLSYVLLCGNLLISAGV